MITNRIPSLSINNAAYNWMSAASSLTNMCSFAANPNVNPNSLLASEQQLKLRMLNDDLIYQASLQQEESLKRLKGENIDRSFSTFA